MYDYVGYDESDDDVDRDVHAFAYVNDTDSMAVVNASETSDYDHYAGFDDDQRFKALVGDYSCGAMVVSAMSATMRTRTIVWSTCPRPHPHTPCNDLPT